jgi:thiol:disulfide interchange protein
MKFISRFLLFISLVLTFVNGFGQIEDPITWKSSISKTGEEEYEIVIEADLEDEWHVYSQFMEMLDEGPLSTYITFETGSNFELVGIAEETGAHTVYEEVWKADISYFEKHAIFTQKIKRLSNLVDTIKGNVNFMICRDTECLAPTDYSFQLSVSGGNEVISEVIARTDSATLAIVPALDKLNLNAPINPDCGDANEENRSNWMLFVLGLLGGLVSLFTPCVFPMIPLTVSFFTKGGKDKNGFAKALLYGASIVAVYVSLSIPFYFGVDGKILNEIAAGATLNIAFFIIFMFFAFSFFGFYELGLPSSWANKADKAADMGGIVGIVFMALVLAIVSFSCTGPLLGSVLAGSLTKGAFPITLAMMGFGVGLGLPFALFAAFPALLKKLPQSGGWLNSVKVVLGFVEVALAFKFFSTADLVQHWGLLKYELFLVIWILCSLGIALYLFGIIKFPHDSPIKKLKPARIILGTSFVALAIYFSMGFRINDKINSYQSLSLLSGIAPPVGYSIMYPLDCPNGFECYHDYEVGQIVSEDNRKPMLVDFTGHACTNCRRMEDQVWSQPEVFDIINDEYILVSLYVDDTEELPIAIQGEIQIPMAGGKFKQQKIVTIGNKWTAFEQLRFGKISQPYYVLLSPDGVLLTNPKAYTSDPKEYADWLRCGLDAWEKLKAGKIKAVEKTENEAPVEVEEITAAKWNYSHNLLDNGEVELSMHASITEGWHLYSQFLDALEGPLATYITFEENDAIEKIGTSTEPDVHKVYDPVWEMEILQFETNATYIQKFKIKGDLPVTLKGKIEYMACDDGKCVNLTEDFEYTITK